MILAEEGSTVIMCISDTACMLEQKEGGTSALQDTELFSDTSERVLRSMKQEHGSQPCFPLTQGHALLFS